MDGIEAISNATIGLVVSTLAVWAVFPLFGWAATGAQSAAVTGLFFGLSAIRGYAVRRFFRWLS